MKDEQKYANIVDMVGDFNNDKNLILQLTQQLADLEVKLAESEKKARTYAKEIVFLDKKLENLNKEFELAQEHNEKTVEYWQNECSQLKQQLAEKEKEIEVMKQMLVDREETIIVAEKSNKGLILNYNQLKQQLVEINKRKNYYKKKHKEALELKIANQNQTAIAELEKVRSKIARLDVSPDESNRLIPALDNYTNGFHKSRFKIMNILDQQIAELKGEK